MRARSSSSRIVGDGWSMGDSSTHGADLTGPFVRMMVDVTRALPA